MIPPEGGNLERMKTSLQSLFVPLMAVCSLSAWGQPPQSVSAPDYDFAVGVVERAYAGYPDKTAGRAAQYTALKERLKNEIARGRDVHDAVAEYLGWFDDSHLNAPGVDAYRPKSRRCGANYPARMKRYDPQFVHYPVDSSTYLIRFPSCDPAKCELAAVQKAVDAFLASGCEDLIVDIRGNLGGNDDVYEPILKLLYDHAGTEDGLSYRVSDLSVAHVEEFGGGTQRSRALLERMKRSPAGSFLDAGPATYRISYDTVSPLPRRAALIIDGWVASSAEQLLLEVRACSGRTTVYGQDRTLGCLDYSNCEILRFPQDTARWMTVPVTRSHRIPSGRGIDSAGIAPDMNIPLPLPETLTDNADQWVLWVAEQLKNNRKTTEI